MILSKGTIEKRFTLIDQMKSLSVEKISIY